MKSFRLYSILIAASFLLLIQVAPCLAEDGPPPEKAVTYNSAYEQTISETRVSFGVLAGYGYRVWSDSHINFVEALPSVSFPITNPVGKKLRGVLEYRMELVLAGLTNSSSHVMAGLSPIGFRYNFTGAGSRLVPYAELMLGAVYIDVPKWIQGKRFDFIESAAVGTRYFISPKTSADFQVRFWHLSNAGISDHNPGINAFLFLAGMSFF